jgi:translation initiation factor IF-3
MDTARNWLDKGLQVTVSVHLRGRETQHWQVAVPILEKFAEELKETAVIAKQPEVHLNIVSMLLVSR